MDFFLFYFYIFIKLIIVPSDFFLYIVKENAFPQKLTV